MLIEFSVENFLSFKDRVTLSLEASRDTELPRNVIESAQGTDLRLLKSAAIYGANASGKSNLLKALRVMAHFLSYAVPFKLDANCLTRPSSFEIVFLFNGVRYLYGFSTDASRVYEEWFYSYPKNHKRLLFERSRSVSSDISGNAFTLLEASEEGYTLPEVPDDDFTFGMHWKGEAKRLAKMTRGNALFVSVASQFNHPLAKIVTNWFKETVKDIQPWPIGKSEEFFTVGSCHKNPEIKTRVLQLLKNADLGIVDLIINERPLEELIMFTRIPPKEREELLQLVRKDNKGKELQLEITTVHQITTPDNEVFQASFEMDEESEGTQKYFALAGPLIYVLSHGCCLLADELDVRLHPLLVRGIVDMFHDEEINTKNAQLIFATHNVDLLDQKSLRRDQVWFTEKNDAGATELYSLWDYRVRKDESIGKGYLAGRYGAVPFIEKLLDISDAQTSFPWH